MNTSLTDLRLEENNVGDAGAAALAKSLQATVLTCGQLLFRASVCCHSKCRFAKVVWRVGVVNLFSSVRAGCFQVDGVRTELGLIEF